MKHCSPCTPGCANIALQALDVGDLTERKAVKSRLHCHNFTWYLDNIWPELTVYDRDVIAWGSVSSGGAQRDINSVYDALTVWGQSYTSMSTVFL